MYQSILQIASAVSFLTFLIATTALLIGYGGGFDITVEQSQFYTERAVWSAYGVLITGLLAFFRGLR